MKRVIAAGSSLTGTALKVPEPTKNRGRQCAGN